MSLFIPDLPGEVQIPENGILSRTLFNDDHLKVVIFGFAPGQELSAHTAPMAAVIQVLQGEGQLTLGSEIVNVKAGAFAHMPPRLEHGILARTPLIMLLLMLKSSVQRVEGAAE